MSRTIKDVPLKHVHPSDDFVVIEQHSAHQSAGGLHIPDRAKVAVNVVRRVGKSVTNVKEGDIVILSSDRSLVFVPECKGLVALAPKDAIAGVIRGIDWSAAMEDATAPELISLTH